MCALHQRRSTLHLNGVAIRPGIAFCFTGGLFGTNQFVNRVILICAISVSNSRVISRAMALRACKRNVISQLHLEFWIQHTSIVEVGPIFGPTLGNLRSCILDLARSAAAIPHLCDLSRNGNTRIATSPLAYARRVSSRHYRHPVFRSC